MWYVCLCRCVVLRFAVSLSLVMSAMRMCMFGSQELALHSMQIQVLTNIYSYVTCDALQICSACRVAHAVFYSTLHIPSSVHFNRRPRQFIGPKGRGVEQHKDENNVAE